MPASAADNLDEYERHLRLDEYERHLRTEDARQASASAEEAVLVELARRLAPVRRSPLTRAVSESDGRSAGTTQPLFAPGELGGAFLEVGTPPSSGSGVPDPYDLRGRPRASGRRPGSWLRASALAPAGAAVIGAALVIAVFGPKAGSPGATQAPHFTASSRSPSVRPPQPSGETVAARGDVDAARLKEAALISVVPSETPPADLGPDDLPAATPSQAAVTQPAPGNSAGPPVAAPVTPAAAAEPAAALAASQSPDLSPVGAVSTQADATAPPAAGAGDAPVAPAAAAGPAAPLAEPRSADSSPAGAITTRADATPLSAADAGDAARHGGPERLAGPARPAESKVVAVARPAAPKLAWRATLSRRGSARAIRANTGATLPGAAAETGRRLQRAEASAAAAAPAEPPATSAPAAAPQPANPVVQAFGALTGQAAKPGDWAVQFAAPKSETEAQTAAQRLNAKYASALNGATIGVHKSLVGGETVYTLRVPGLSKADAAALCMRVKGRDCSSLAK